MFHLENLADASRFLYYTICRKANCFFHQIPLIIFHQSTIEEKNDGQIYLHKIIHTLAIDSSIYLARGKMSDAKTITQINNQICGIPPTNYC